MSGISLYNKSFKCAEKILQKKTEVIIWGCGKRFEENYEFITSVCTIEALYDENVLAKKKMCSNLNCQEIDNIKNCTSMVMITMADERIKEQVATKLIMENLEFVYLDDLIFLKRRQDAISSNSGKIDYYREYNDNAKMKAYVGINVPVTICNLRCDYCYISQKGSCIAKNPHMKGVPEYIGRFLSYVKEDEAFLIGLCGNGETLLGDQFIELCIELLNAGHYLHIVTNGILTDKIKTLIERAGINAAHILFKMSFHYKELRDKKLLMKFVESVQYIDASVASYTIELVPHDELLDQIEEIKLFSKKYFGAFPHVTIGRNEMDGRKLLSKLSYEEYYKVWKQFDSSLFEYKMKMYEQKGCECNAGRYTININLETGKISRCTTIEECVGNAYTSEKLCLNYEKVKDDCPLGYCYNCHVYGPLGIIASEKGTPTYLEIRDRKKNDGGHWIKEPMARFLKQRICDNY